MNRSNSLLYLGIIPVFTITLLFLNTEPTQARLIWIPRYESAQYITSGLDDAYKGIAEKYQVVSFVKHTFSIKGLRNNFCRKQLCFMKRIFYLLIAERTEKSRGNR